MATVSSVSLNPTSLVYPATSIGTVTLSEAAPSGGILVSLLSSDPTVAIVPTSVTALEGETTATFTVTPLNKTADSTITASVSGGSSAHADISVSFSELSGSFGQTEGKMAAGYQTQSQTRLIGPHMNHIFGTSHT